MAWRELGISVLQISSSRFGRRDTKAHTDSSTHVDDFDLKNSTAPTCNHAVTISVSPSLDVSRETNGSSVHVEGLR
jgi:hypothetical protein